MIKVSPDYFRVLGVPLLQGRLLTARDERSEPRVVVANEAFVRQFFPDQNPLGHRVSGNPSEEPVWEEIVGVVGNIHQGGLDRDVAPTVYRCSLQGGRSADPQCIRSHAFDPRRRKAGCLNRPRSTDLRCQNDAEALG